jgi:hypothetical protein
MGDSTSEKFCGEMLSIGEEKDWRVWKSHIRGGGVAGGDKNRAGHL